MDIFEFVASFYVVLAGLGVTLLARSVGQMLESRTRISFYWIHSLLLLFIFLAHVNSWFTLWAYRDLESWTVGQLLLLIAVPTLLYLASHVSVPEINEHETISHDMCAYYYARHRLLFGLLASAVVVNLACEYVLLGERVVSLNNTLRLAALVVLAVGAASSRPRVHAAVTLALLAILGVGAAFLGHQVGY